MSELTLAAVSHGPLLDAAGSFRGALTVIFGDDPRSLATLVAVASGAEAPRRGHTLLDGAPLFGSPTARRRVASLLDAERLPAAPSVEAAVGQVLSAREDGRLRRGEPHAARTLLAAFGLERWAARRPETLDRDEQRSVALALALAHEGADLFVLYEPLATSALDAPSVRAALGRASERNAIVVLVTANLPTAESLGGPHCAIERGVLGSFTPVVAGTASAPPNPAAAPASTGLPALPAGGPRPADQVVNMPTEFAEPTRPSRGSDS